MNNNQTNNKEDSKMKINNVLMNGGSSINAQELFQQFVKNGVTVKPQLDIGEHAAVFAGLDIDMVKMTFKFKFEVSEKSYDFSMQYSLAPTSEGSQYTKADQLLWTLQDLAKQLKLDGSISFDEYNKHIGKSIKVYATKYGNTVYYNFKGLPKLVSEAIAEETITNTEF